MLQNIEFLGGSNLGGGVVTFPNFFVLKPEQSPNALNVKFVLGGAVEKRLGTSTMNATALPETPAGYGSFDFGATNFRWLVVSAGTGIYAASDRGVGFVSIATDRSLGYQFFERSKSFLIATSDSRDSVLFWAGSVGTYMQLLAPNSAPAVKRAIAYQGFLFLMNTQARPRGMFYAPEASFTTDAWASNFDLPSSFDDEIVEATLLNRKLYVFMRYKTFRVSFIGGNPDFGYQDIKDWGAIPGTVKKITLPEIGEVIICLDWNRNLRIFDGSDDQIISDGFKDSNGESIVYMKAINTNALTRARAENDTNELVYKLLVPIGTANTTPGHAICFNYRIGALYPYEYTHRGFMRLQMAQSGNSQVLLGIDSAGRIHVMDSGNVDTGTAAVNEFYDSPFYFNRNPQTVTKTQKMALYFSPTSSGDIRFQDRSDLNNVFQGIRSTISFASTGNQLQKFSVIDIPVTQNIQQFRISNSGSTANPWRLNRIDFSGTTLGVGKA